jgi:predicted RecB family nuclease
LNRIGDRYIYSPTDLVNFTLSEFITWMDRYAWERPGEIEPDPPSEEQKLIQDKGAEHENAFLNALEAGGRRVCDLSEFRGRPEPTLDAMRRGEEIIYQGYLVNGEFAGYPDFLVRVEMPSAIGAWSYEPWDTKLARHPKPYFLIQLCCYAELLEAAQSLRPKWLRVVLGSKGADGPETAAFRTDDFFFYYRAVKEAFLDRQHSFDSDRRPEIPPLRDLGHWSGYAERELTERDDLALVANIRTSQIHKLRAAGIRTVAQLAGADGVHIPRLNGATFAKLGLQARLQIASRGKPVPAYELLTPDETDGPRGLSLLPHQSAADVFFDMEGFPLIDDGREYLFGACYYAAGALRFRDWWAHSPDQERRAFASFVHWAHGRWREHPELHIYHYSHYETNALRRLMGKYGTCEQEVDDLLRNGVFVDLYRVVRQSVMIGEPSYSLKYVEHLYHGRREGDVASAGESIVFYQRWLIAQDGDTPETSAILKQIRDYNEEDCRSTAELACWLRCRQKDAGIVPRAAEEVPEETTQETEVKTDNARRHALAQEILGSLAVPRSSGPADERQRITELLAWLLEFHRREEKPIWWRRFDRMDMEERELIDDPDCLGGLQRTRRPPVPVKQSFAYEYSFDPHQETRVRAGDACLFAHDWTQRARIDELDFDSGRIVLIVSRKQGTPPNRLSIVPDEPTLGKLLAPAVERVVKRWIELGHFPCALEDFLFRRRPRFLRNLEGPIIPSGADTLEECIAAGLEMRGTTLCVQGPPGSGKTFTGARMVAALLRAGKRVGIASNSHRAINLLLAEARREARKLGFRGQAVKVCRDEEDLDGLPDGIRQIESGRDLFGYGAMPQLIGGTAFAFSCEEAQGALDYLFVDEAGQVSLANLVAMAPAATNLVLLGDQMQLGQPIQGSHPGESGLSALEYLLQGQATLRDDFGIFLPRTWRLHPALCHFISGAVYEDRLGCEPQTAERVIVAGTQSPPWMTRTAGLVYVPVEHEGNVYESTEEEEQIACLVRDLMAQRVRDENGGVRGVTADDILVVAPYNLQVRRLERRLRPIRVGTVDKFQGQEAAVVIFSMCGSNGEVSPRGIEFLFSRNRLNVAISRAQTLAMVVASPALVRTRCSSIDQIRLVNMYCRAVVEASGGAGAVAGGR